LLVSELNIRATNALDRARKMPRGHDRAGALRKAKILLNAAEMLKHLSRKVGGAGRITAEI
jgi:hypothetical protein